jgi:hypothetical protein
MKRISATPGTPSRRTGRKPKYVQYEVSRPARREHAPNAAPSPTEIRQKGPSGAFLAVRPVEARLS